MHFFCFFSRFFVTIFGFFLLPLPPGPGHWPATPRPQDQWVLEGSTYSLSQVEHVATLPTAQACDAGQGCVCVWREQTIGVGANPWGEGHGWLFLEVFLPVAPPPPPPPGLKWGQSDPLRVCPN